MTRTPIYPHRPDGDAPRGRHWAHRSNANGTQSWYSRANPSGLESHPRPRSSLNIPVTPSTPCPPSPTKDLPNGWTATYRGDDDSWMLQSTEEPRPEVDTSSETFVDYAGEVPITVTRFHSPHHPTQRVWTVRGTSRGRPTTYTVAGEQIQQARSSAERLAERQRGELVVTTIVEQRPYLVRYTNGVSFVVWSTTPAYAVDGADHELSRSYNRGDHDLRDVTPATTEDVSTGAYPPDWPELSDGTRA